jgi:hypothetical protein
MDKNNEIDECKMATSILESGTFSNEQILELLTRGRMIIPDMIENKSKTATIQVGTLTVDEGGKPVAMILSCHDLIDLVNYIAKEVLQ